MSIRRLPRNGRSPVSRLVEDDPEAVDVAAGVNPARLAPRLLGGHVGGRPEDLALLGHRGVLCLSFCQAKVHEMGLALIVKEDVCGLDVAVDHPVTVGVVECVGHSGDEFCRLPGWQRPVGKSARECRPLDELLDQIERPVVGLAGFVKGDDPRVLELGGAPCFAKKPRHVLRAAHAPRPWDLDRYHAPELGISGSEHVAERARAQPFVELELAEAMRSLFGREPGRLASRAGRTHRRDEFARDRLSLRYG